MKRLRELDALRGLAAVSVVLLHFHDMWLNSYVVHLTLKQVRLATALTPLYAGSEAVVLFFLLSGLVLALPFEHGKPQSYRVFLIRRITRIYGPYLCALALAVAASAIWHGDLHHGPWPAGVWATAPTLSSIAAHVGFIGVYNWGRFNVVIWSLIHEMRISIVFPALWWITHKGGTWLSLALAAAFSAIALLLSTQPVDSAAWSFALTLHYMGFFIVGILIARNLTALHRRVEAWRSPLPALLLSLILYFGGMGLFYDRVLTKHLQPRAATIAGNWIVLLGAIGFVLLGSAVPTLCAILNSRIPLFLGRISYSLYLIHFLVLMALTFAAGSLSAWIQFPIYLVLSFTLATLFCLFVEEPFMRLGRALTSTPG